MSASSASGPPPSPSLPKLGWSSRVRWGWLTLAGWTACVTLTPILRDQAGTLRTVLNVLLGVALVTTLVCGIVGGSVQRRGDGLTLRRGWNPFGVAFGLFLLTLIPVGVAVSQVLGVGHHLHFEVTMGAEIVLCGLAAGVVRPRVMRWDDEGLVVDVLLGRRHRRWIALRTVRADAARRALVLEHRDGRAWRVRYAGSDLEQQAARLRRDGRLADEPPGPAAEAWSEAGRWALLERSGRPLPIWTEAMAALAVGDEGFRQLPVSRHDLERMVLDPDAPAERRLGAALGLHACGDPPALEILSRAARGARPRPLRAAFRAVARGRLDERTLRRALAVR